LKVGAKVLFNIYLICFKIILLIRFQNVVATNLTRTEQNVKVKENLFLIFIFLNFPHLVIGNCIGWFNRKI